MTTMPPERGAYQLLDFIDSFTPNPGVLVELGARDCNETSVFSRYLPFTHVYTFECNPATLPICRKVSKDLPNVTLIEKAVAEKNGSIDFFAIDPEKTKTTWKDGNPGASSLLKASGKYPIEEYGQKKVKVKTTRLDSFMKSCGVSQIDVLWMDIQGAELMALKSLGSELSNVKLIYTEVEFLEIYEGQPLFDEVYRFLKKNGFLLVSLLNVGDFSADAVFINSKLLDSHPKKLRARLNEKRLVDTAMGKINAHKNS